MIHRLYPSTALSHETARRGEYTSTPLPRLHSPRDEALPVTDTLNVVEDGCILWIRKEGVEVGMVNWAAERHCAITAPP